jgi:CRISPR/Cas system CSM-associated protein Csm3 (group 7 of RAMP superfamily)
MSYVKRRKIILVLKVTKFRVGSNVVSSEYVDLPSFAAQVTGATYYLVPASSLKGILRRSTESILNYFKNDKKTDMEKAYVCLFGNQENRGIIRIIPKPANKFESQIRTSIKVDKIFGSVSEHTLFNYQYWESVDEPAKLEFEINFARRPSEDEVFLLISSLMAVRGSTIGGFGSRGMGIINDVKLEYNDFNQEYQEAKRRLFG